MYRTVIGFYLLSAFAAGQTFRPDIPRAWDDGEVEAFQVPLAQRDRSPRFLNSKEYYALRSPPAYLSHVSGVCSRSPASRPGYMEGLQQKEPEILFDASKLRTEAGLDATPVMIGLRFVIPIPGDPASPLQMAMVAGAPATRDGVIPLFRYVIRKKGVVEIGGGSSCRACHTRLMPDGSLIKGAQERAASALGQIFASIPAFAIRLRWTLFGTPWVSMNLGESEWWRCPLSSFRGSCRSRQRSPGCFLESHIQVQSQHAGSGASLAIQRWLVLSTLDFPLLGSQETTLLIN